ncbi:SDR family oxidoreductase [Streptomyces brasiliscabiei]|uniref:SDR family oxidoreductase n=1 Tax=Streptomyces brasiliscabiei TaxID=2736302 RepID=A0ABU8GJP6_9ACTN
MPTALDILVDNAGFDIRGGEADVARRTSTASWPYTPRKSALDALTRTLARSLAKVLGARRIRVNSVAPGFVKADLNRQRWSTPENEAAHASLSVFGRMGQPTDVADIVAFLASDDARRIPGRRIDASGGTGL